MTRVIHTADTHIGYRQYNSPERRRDFLAAFERVVADAVEMDVDAVVHAGDVFHDRRPALPDLLGTISALRELSAAGVPFLAVVGNHEDKRDAQWLDLFEELDLAVRLDETGHAVGDTTFYGLDHVPRSRRDQLDYEFDPPDTDHAALVAHGLFEPFAHADWDTGHVLAESTVDFDAVLLGDNHHPDTARVADTWVTYAGSTERASADEEADRGYNVVAFGADAGTDGEDDGDVRIARRGLPTRPFEFVDVELREGEGVDRVRERVRERDLDEAVVVVRIDGDGEPVTPATVEEFARERGALVVRVTDRRELAEADADLDVQFADPDAAVRERVRKLGLSEAARGVDERVRASDLADSNVRSAVAEEVHEMVDAGLDAFEPADDATDGDASAVAEDGTGETTGDAGGDGDAGAAVDGVPGSAVADDGEGDATAARARTGDAAEAAAATDDAADASDNDDDDAGGDDADAAGADDADASDNDDDAAGADDAADASDSDDDDAGADDADAASEPADDGQASMEEYL